MLRKIIKIDEEKCNGCGLCAAACHEGAIGMVNGKAKLLREDFIKNRITLIGCPKLDEGDYTDKLTAIIANNNIKSFTIVRMEVPCCGGIEQAAKRALQASGKFIPWRVVVVTTDGRLLE